MTLLTSANPECSQRFDIEIYVSKRPEKYNTDFSFCFFIVDLVTRKSRKLLLEFLARQSHRLLAGYLLGIYIHNITAVCVCFMCRRAGYYIPESHRPRSSLLLSLLSLGSRPGKRRFLGKRTATFPSLHTPPPPHHFPMTTGCCCLGYRRRAPACVYSRRRRRRRNRSSRVRAFRAHRPAEERRAGIHPPPAVLPHPALGRIDLCRPFNPTRRHLPSLGGSSTRVGRRRLLYYIPSSSSTVTTTTREKRNFRDSERKKKNKNNNNSFSPKCCCCCCSYLFLFSSSVSLSYPFLKGS